MQGRLKQPPCRKPVFARARETCRNRFECSRIHYRLDANGRRHAAQRVASTSRIEAVAASMRLAMHRLYPGRSMHAADAQASQAKEVQAMTCRRCGNRRPSFYIGPDGRCWDCAFVSPAWRRYRGGDGGLQRVAGDRDIPLRVTRLAVRAPPIPRRPEYKRRLVQGLI